MWFLELQLHHLTFFWQRSSGPGLGEEIKHMQGTELQVTSWSCQPGVSCLNPHPLSLVGFHQQQLSSRSAYPCNVSNAFRSIIHAWFSRTRNLAGSHSTECFTLQEKSADLFSFLTILIKKKPTSPTNKVGKLVTVTSGSTMQNQIVKYADFLRKYLPSHPPTLCFII